MIGVYRNFDASASGAPATDFSGPSARVKAALHASALRGLDTRDPLPLLANIGAPRNLQIHAVTSADLRTKAHRENARDGAFNLVAEITGVFTGFATKFSRRNSPRALLAGLIT